MPNLLVDAVPLPLPANANANAGIGLRAQHHSELLERSPAVPWVEAHSENYFADGGAHIEALFKIRSRYSLSLHGVGLSVGSSDALDAQHLKLLRRNIDRFQPMLVSEHLSWSSVGGRFANDLLPLPYTDEALQHVANRIANIQDALGRQILVENVSSYLEYTASQMPEWTFLAGVATEAGCGILLDLNNIYVAARNHGFKPLDYLNAIPASTVQEFHLAGYSAINIDGQEILIDTHGAPVCTAVWNLYAGALQRFGTRPTLIEWDTDIPELDVLIAEAHKADQLRHQYGRA